MDLFFSETHFHRSRIQSQLRGTLHFGLQRCTNKSGTELRPFHASPNPSQPTFLPDGVLFLIRIASLRHVHSRETPNRSTGFLQSVVLQMTQWGAL